MPLKVIRKRWSFENSLAASGLTATYTGTHTPAATVNEGVAVLELSDDNEEQTSRLDLGDNLAIPVEDLIELRIRAQLQSADGGVDAYVGIAAAGDGDPANLAGALLFHLNEGEGGGGDITVDFNDGEAYGVDETDVDTGTDWSTGVSQDFVADFKSGLIQRDPREAAGDQGGVGCVQLKVTNAAGLLRAVCQGEIIDLSDWTGGCQPFVLARKDSGTDTAVLIVHWIEIQYAVDVSG